jgi:hypothetical protein
MPLSERCSGKPPELKDFMGRAAKRAGLAANKTITAERAMANTFGTRGLQSRHLTARQGRIMVNALEVNGRAACVPHVTFGEFLRVFA